MCKEAQLLSFAVRCLTGECIRNERLDRAVELLALQRQPLASIGHSRSGLACGNSRQHLGLGLDVLLDFKQVGKFTKHHYSITAHPAGGECGTSHYGPTANNIRSDKKK